ncbi:MAG: glucosaminidase domain-containing protein [Alphaproteobacteria bacterium]
MVRRIRTKSKCAQLPGRTVVALHGLLAVLGFVLPAVLAIYLSDDSRPLGPRRVTDVIERFLTHGYDLDAVAGGNGRVPRIFLPRIPKDWRGLVQADKRKQAFVILVLPLVLQANEHVYAARQRLLDLAVQKKKGKAPSAPDQEWLQALAKSYGTKSDDLKELVLRVDIIPPSLALAQAAIESGWGTSRFTTEGNALFGQWTMDEAKAMVPSGRDQGATYGIRRYPTLAESVASYFRNLNSHGAYAKFRKRRAALRAKGKALNGVELAKYLESYSARGADYVQSVQKVITANRYAPLDEARLQSEAGQTLLGVLPKRQ